MALLANGQVFGRRAFSLHLLDSTENAVQTAKYEIETCGFELVESVSASTQVDVAMRGVQVAILLNSDNESLSVAQKCSAMFAYAKALRFADKNVRVLTLDNLDCMCLSRCAPFIPVEHITSLSQLMIHRAMFELSQRANCDFGSIENVVVFGGTRSKVYVDVQKATVVRGGVKLSAKEACTADSWSCDPLCVSIQRKSVDCASLSVARAIGDHLRTWIVTGTKPGQLTSLGVHVEGSNPYGIRAGLFF